MESKAVPQDEITTLTNTRKAIYAISGDGSYEIVPSTGWAVEAEATLQAVDELARQAAAAYDQVACGAAAPLYFHMFNRRMDINVLSQASGIARWRLKRHLKPEVFVKLPLKTLARYAEALGLEVGELQRLPETGSDRA